MDKKNIPLPVSILITCVLLLGLYPFTQTVWQGFLGIHELEVRISHLESKVSALEHR